MPDPIKIKLSSLIDVKKGETEVSYEKFYAVLDKTFKDKFEKVIDGKISDGLDLGQNGTNEIRDFRASKMMRPEDLGVGNASLLGESYSIPEYIAKLFAFLGGGLPTGFDSKGKPLKLSDIMKKHGNDPRVKNFIDNKN
jgi:hypothetical protein